MRTLRPIRDFDSYSRPIAKAIYDQLNELIYAPLMEIIKPIEKMNELAHGKPNLYFQGFKIHIESPKGTYRHGKEWTQLMANDYGYICDTMAIDGDELDCFVGPNIDSPHVYIVEQINPKTGKFDEYKVMFGFNDSIKAKRSYLANYQLGWKGFGSVIERDIFNFWDWYAVNNGQEILNAKDSVLVDALKRGIIEYRDGYFVGNLRAAISKELRSYGAFYNKVRKVYYLEIAKMPQAVLQAIAAGNQASQAVLNQVQAFLRATEGREVRAPDLEPLFGDILKKLDKQFYVTTKPVTGADLEIPLNPKFEYQIKEAYTENLDKYIQKWHDEAILRLREKVSQNVEAGFRAESLIDIIKSERRVSQNKAVFLARTENSLMTAAYRKIRYEDIGVTDYIWSSAHDSRVRPWHRELNGQRFSFNDPPVIDINTMKRGNPGDTYNCRCVAIPYLKGKYNFMEPTKTGEYATTT